MSLVANEHRLARCLLAPTLALIAAVAIYPIAHAMWLSLHDRELALGIYRFAGLSNYWRLLWDGRFWNALSNTAYFVAVSVALELLLGLGIALVLHQRFRGRGLLRASVLVPWAIPTVVTARMWEWIFNSDFGVLNHLISRAGLAEGGVNWLGSTFWAMNAAILADVWKATPFAALLLLAGLQTIPEELHEAARVDGATRWSAFRHITLPLLMPVIVVTTLLRTLDAIRVFDVIYVLTGGGPANSTETLSIYAYKVLFSELSFGYGSAIAVATFVTVTALAFVYLRILARRDYE